MKLTPSKISFTIIGIIMLWVSSNLNFGKDHWRGVLEADAKGYYAYLPATFIYHDLNFNFFNNIEKTKYYDPHYYYDYRAYHNNKTIDKYFCGTAIMEMPFFLGAHAITKCSSLPADGFSRYYCLAVNIAAIFYLLAGLWFLRKLFLRYQILERNIALALFAAAFGTNLFYYAAVEPGMSHVYSFALISFFLYNTKILLAKCCKQRILLNGLLLGLIFLVRPVNLIVVLTIPFLAGDKQILFSFFKALWERIGILFLAAAIMFGLISMQFIIYKISCGSFFVDSYPGESFHFLSPHMFDILFSYRKGLFLYTPMYLLFLSGLFFVFKKSHYAFYSFVIFFLILTYVLSSWWSWWYGGSFSSRVYIDYISVIVLPFAILLNEIKAFSKKIFIAVTFFLILLCQVQTYQYRYNQIHWDGMTKEKYWKEFLRIDKLVAK